MKSKRGIILLLTTLLMIMLVLLVGCAIKRDSSKVFYIYDMNREHTRIIPNEYRFSTDYSAAAGAASGYVGEALNRMIAGPNIPEETGAIGTDVGDITFHVDGSIAYVNFNDTYYDADLTTRTLRRAAVVRTLCQIEGIRGVGITVNYETVVDSDGQPIGVLTADSYLENDGAKINAYEKTVLRLYFTNAEGNKLIEVNEPVVYDSNISMEKLVVDSLIEGPDMRMVMSGICPTINPTTKNLNVTVKDGVCYVNLSSDFLSKTTNVSDEIVIYSIVNSLTNLANANKVQLMIDGETEVSFGGVYLSAPFESDYGLLSKEER